MRLLGKCEDREDSRASQPQSSNHYLPFVCKDLIVSKMSMKKKVSQSFEEMLIVFLYYNVGSVTLNYCISINADTTLGSVDGS